METYYEEGGLTLYHGDALDVLPLLPPVTITITDPPYNVGMDYPRGDLRCDYKEWSRLWFAAAPRPLVFTPGTMNLGMWYDIEHPHWLCAWFKINQASPSRLGGFNVWEPILVYGKPAKRVGHDAWNHLVSFREKERGAGDHPCPKTLSFWMKLIDAFTEPGDTVLDCFVGSGTTLEACKKLGRNVIGIESDEKYCEIAAQRFAQSSLLDLIAVAPAQAEQDGLFVA